MSEVRVPSKRVTQDDDDVPSSPPTARAGRKAGIRVVPVLTTLVAVALAGSLSWAMWQAYMAAPWTRDGTVRAYVVTMAPEVAGRIVELPVADNQLVHKGDLLMVIDPENYTIGVRLADAAVDQAKAVMQNAQAEAKRREQLTTLSISEETKQIYVSQALSANAAYQQALANRDQARVNLARTRIMSPANGYVTNLLAQLGDYVNVGQRSISVINADSFWIDAYFEETSLRSIREGDPATVKLMGYPQIVPGHVEGIARGINVANAQADPAGLALVNPIFTWVRLAQRVPVRIRIDAVPEGVRLVVGMTATVQIEGRQPPG
jgi:multidrug resistance efflux pump